MRDATDGVEVWRGTAVAWECDETGRLEPRFLLARAMEGLAGLAAELGMTDAFAQSASSTLAVREHHIRFLSDARAGAPLAIRAGVLSIRETEAEVLLLVRHARSGEPCAAVLTRVAHLSVREPRVFPWSARTRAAAAALAVEAPGFARPDGLADAPAEPDASCDRAEALALALTGRGVVQPHECDVFGRLRPDAVIGRCAAAAAHLAEGGGGTTKDARPDARLLELRIRYLRAAVVGARLEVRSAAAGIAGGLQRFTHWLLDPEGGEAWASAQALWAGVDLDAEKAARTAPKPQLADEMEL